MTYIETHCHLDYLKQLPTEEIIQKAKEQNIEKIMTISVEPDNLQTVIDIANTYENVYCSQGIHPHDAKLANDNVLKTIKENALKESKVLALGEMGLDYHYDNSPRDIQKKYFRAQLELAAEIDYPVVIHTRDADDDTIEILKDLGPSLNRKGVLHSFTSTPKLAEVALDLGFYIGFNGIITFKKAQEVRDIVSLTPIEKILLETDSPFLTPVPHRGKENAPFYLPFVAQKVAQIKELPLEEVQEQCYQNSIDLFKF
jgi:TatD DNase family protein